MTTKQSLLNCIATYRNNRGLVSSWFAEPTSITNLDDFIARLPGNDQYELTDADEWALLPLLIKTPEHCGFNDVFANLRINQDQIFEPLHLSRAEIFERILAERAEEHVQLNQREIPQHLIRILTAANLLNQQNIEAIRNHAHQKKLEYAISTLRTDTRSQRNIAARIVHAILWDSILTQDTFNLVAEYPHEDPEKLANALCKLSKTEDLWTEENRTYLAQSNYPIELSNALIGMHSQNHLRGFIPRLLNHPKREALARGIDHFLTEKRDNEAAYLSADNFEQLQESNAPRQHAGILKLLKLNNFQPSQEVHQGLKQKSALHLYNIFIAIEAFSKSVNPADKELINENTLAFMITTVSIFDHILVLDRANFQVQLAILRVMQHFNPEKSTAEYVNDEAQRLQDLQPAP